MIASLFATKINNPIPGNVCVQDESMVQPLYLSNDLAQYGKNPIKK